MPPSAARVRACLRRPMDAALAAPCNSPFLARKLVCTRASNARLTNADCILSRKAEAESRDEPVVATRRTSCLPQPAQQNRCQSSRMQTVIHARLCSLGLQTAISG
eukprot:4482039-Pleurochrysis_carterae.AAC.1